MTSSDGCTRLCDIEEYMSSRCITGGFRIPIPIPIPMPMPIRDAIEGSAPKNEGGSGGCCCSEGLVGKYPGLGGEEALPKKGEEEAALFM